MSRETILILITGPVRVLPVSSPPGLCLAGLWHDILQRWLFITYNLLYLSNCSGDTEEGCWLPVRMLHAEKIMISKRDSNLLETYPICCCIIHYNGFLKTNGHNLDKIRWLSRSFIDIFLLFQADWVSEVHIWLDWMKCFKCLCLQSASPLASSHIWLCSTLIMSSNFYRHLAAGLYCLGCDSPV